VIDYQKVRLCTRTHTLARASVVRLRVDRREAAAERRKCTLLDERRSPPPPVRRSVPAAVKNGVGKGPRRVPSDGHPLSDAPAGP